MSFTITDRSRVVLDNVEPPIKQAANTIIDGLRDSRRPRDDDQSAMGDESTRVARLPSGWRLVYHISDGDVVIEDIVNAQRYR